MGFIKGLLWLLPVLFGLAFCQIHYIPAQILIPTLNGSLLLSNHTVYNKTNGSPVVNNTYNVGNNRTNYTTPYNGSQDGHLILGTVQPYDRLLFNQIYFKPGRWYSGREKIIEYPNNLPVGYSRHETITAIKIMNQFYDGNTARAEILAGGIGRQYVKIKLHSKWGYGFRYWVNIYGR